jgi:hypothetical protein
VSGARLHAVGGSAKAPLVDCSQYEPSLMMPHPENDSGPLKALQDAFADLNPDVVPIKCQCGADTVINKAYAQYVKGPISGCKACR